MARLISLMQRTQKDMVTGACGQLPSAVSGFRNSFLVEMKSIVASEWDGRWRKGVKGRGVLGAKAGGEKADPVRELQVIPLG